MSPSRAEVRVRCPAKINTVLRVLSRRADGFHELDTEFVSLALHDRLRLRPASGFSLEVLGAPEGTVPVEDNLVLRAARSLQRALGADCLPGAEMSLEKRIPAAAGLGGGSSDAAGALLGLCRLHGLRPPAGLLTDLALELGSDVPYFLEGGRQRGRGRGELLEPLPARPTAGVILIYPRAGLSTRAVFEAHAELGSRGREGALTKRKMTPTFQNTWWKLPGFQVGNELREAALEVAPGLSDLEASLRRRFPGEVVGMTGSGPTWFVLSPEDEAPARPDFSGLDGLRWGGHRVFVTRTVDHEEYQSTRFLGGPGS